jgi:Zn-dependent protease with chaperone function
MLCATIASFFAEPLINGYSRTIEHDADMYGFNLKKDGLAFARTFASLSKENLSEPSPPEFVRLWLFSHPPLSERIESVMKAK